MRILSITTQKPHSTGSGVYLTELVNSFASAGIKQAVVAGLYPEDAAIFPEGVTFYPVHYTSAGQPENDIPYPVLGMSDIMPYESTRYNQLTDEMADQMFVAFKRTIMHAIEELQPDVILCHHLYLLTSSVKAMAQEAGEKLGLDIAVYGLSHGSDLRQFENCSFHRDEIAAGIRQLDGIFALHEEQAQKISSFFDIPASKIEIVGTGYNAKIFTSEGRRGGDLDQLELVYAGKLSREKGLFPFLNVLKKLAADPDFPKFRLSMAGGCQDPEILELLTGEAPDEEDTGSSCDGPSLLVGPLPALGFKARYMGMLSHQQLAETFRSSDIFVLPSYYEGLPLVLTEAMACGLIPVCTDLPGVRPWLDSTVSNSNAIFVPCPRMVTAGVPEESALPQFELDLEQAIRQAAADNEARRDGSLPAPNTSRASWQGVAETILQTMA